MKLEKLQRWRMRVTDEVEEILEELDALKAQPLEADSVRQGRAISQVSLPDVTEQPAAVEELVDAIREYVTFAGTMDHPDWFGPIEQLIVQSTAFLGRLFDETERILSEAEACEHPFSCRCQRQLRFFEEKIRPVVKEWEELIAYAEALRGP